MTRTSNISDTKLIARLAKAFKDYGYNGASMKILSEASSLQKASLYHRFPGGKEQMAQEVLKQVNMWIDENLAAPLLKAEDTMTAKEKIQRFVKQLDMLYQGGRESCLLNMLSHPVPVKGPFTSPIKNAFKTLIDILALILENDGLGKKKARDRAAHALMLLHGGLVLSRGTGTTTHFRYALLQIEAVLLGHVST